MGLGADHDRATGRDGGRDNLIFGGDPPLPERCTVGGLLATAAAWSRGVGYGAVRDYCIGIRFVTAMRGGRGWEAASSKMLRVTT